MSIQPLRRILLVEDNLDIQAVAQLALEAVGGFNVIIASSGSEALTAVTTVLPDLILLDVMLPDMDGRQILAALRRREETVNIPVIFLTAKVQTHEVAHYKALGALEVVAKPFNPMTISSTIARIWAAQQVTSNYGQ